MWLRLWIDELRTRNLDSTRDAAPAPRADRGSGSGRGVAPCAAAAATAVTGSRVSAFRVQRVRSQRAINPPFHFPTPPQAPLRPPGVLGRASRPRSP
eukprot:5242810-Prymnesium_polylepis.1